MVVDILRFVYLIPSIPSNHALKAISEGYKLERNMMLSIRTVFEQRLLWYHIVAATL